MKKKNICKQRKKTAFRNWNSVTDRGDEGGEAMTTLAFVRKATTIWIYKAHDDDDQITQ
jgi:hypothetical protein